MRGVACPGAPQQLPNLMWRCRCDDSKWPEPNEGGKQELEVVLGRDHISFTCSKINSLLDVNDAEDADGLRALYYLVQDLKCLVFGLVSVHFKIKPIP